MELKGMWNGLSVVRHRAMKTMVVGAAVSVFTGGAWGQCELQKIMASDADPADYFGGAVAMDGDLAVIGAFGVYASRGAAYVFRYDGSAWNEEAKLEASDGMVGDHFGWSVALSGDAVIVGANQDDDHGVDRGSAYVFRYDGDTWNEEAKLLASDGTEEDWFGYSVAISGDVAVVGASQDDDGGTWAGSAYVFRHNGSAWVEEDKILGSDTDSFDLFGSSVAIEGELLTVGAYYKSGDSAYGGAAYAFRYTRSQWIEEAKLTASDLCNFDFFGTSVALHNDVIAVGASQMMNDYAPGKAYIFRYDGSTWKQEARLLPWDGEYNDIFGDSVAIHGDVAVIGAPYHENNWFGDGSAYVFRFNGSAWVGEAEVMASDGAAGDMLGKVATDGQVVLAGAYGYSNDGTGSAYFFHAGLVGEDCNGNRVADECESANGFAHDCQPNGVPDECDIDFGASDDVNDNGVPDECEPLAPCKTDRILASFGGYRTNFGYSVDIEGDIAVVGSSVEKACVLRYDPDTAQWLEEVTLAKPASDAFGYGIALQDGWLVVGAPRDNELGYGAGSAFVFRYDGTSWIEHQKLLASDGRQMEFFGCSVAIDGEYLIIGADEYFSDTEGPGWAYVYRFDGSNWIEQQKLGAADGENKDRFGGAVAIQHDIILVGATGDNSKRGAVYYFKYDPDSMAWSELQKLQSAEGGNYDRFGRCVSISGDYAVIGEDFSDDDGANAGLAYFFRLDAGGQWVQEQEMHASDPGDFHHYGYSACIEGDTALIGAAWSEDIDIWYGATYVYRFTGQTWEESGVLYGDQPHWDQFGNAVAISGDRAIIGANTDSSQDQWSGAAYIVNGLLGVDCNDNEVPDACDIFYGTSEDLNNNGIPDECETCPEDLNNDGVVNIDDLFQVLAVWGTCDDCPEDLDDSGMVDIDDIFAVLAAWGPCA